MKAAHISCPHVVLKQRSDSGGAGLAAPKGVPPKDWLTLDAPDDGQSAVAPQIGFL